MLDKYDKLHLFPKRDLMVSVRKNIVFFSFCMTADSGRNHLFVFAQYCGESLVHVLIDFRNLVFKHQ